jgi:hypothetical protein
MAAYIVEIRPYLTGGQQAKADRLIREYHRDQRKLKAEKAGQAQGSMFDPPDVPHVPYVRQGTSIEAAGRQAASGKALTDEERVLDLIRSRGDRGATDDEIEAALNLRHQTASARRRGLVIGNLVIDSGRRRQTRSGYDATIWVLREKV